MLLPQVMGHLSANWTDQLGFHEVANFLLKVKSGIFQVDTPVDCHERTLLYHAVRLKQYKFMGLLLKAGALPTNLDPSILEELLKTGPFLQFVQLVLKGLRIPEESGFIDLAMQKLCEYHKSLLDDKFREVMKLLLPQMMGRRARTGRNK